VSDSRAARNRGPDQPRPYCYRCDKPAPMCLCGHLSPIPNAVGVQVLQHPAERRHALGTARLLRLGLQSVRVHVLGLRAGSAVAPPVALPPGAGLLYPSPEARELTELAPEDRPSHLVVIDGTWSQAHRLYRDNAWIASLPHYRLSPEVGSNYRIRTEPRAECLSTVESVVAALRCLQPGLEGTDALLAAFDAMIDAQIEAASRPSIHPRRSPQRKIPAQPVPAVLRGADARIVVAYTEAEPRWRQSTQPGPPIRLSAVTLDGSRVFDRLIRSDRPPDAYVAAQMELHAEALGEADDRATVLADFRAFCHAGAGPAPVVVSWNVRTFRWLEAGLGGTRCVLLKGVWANICKTRVPELEPLVQGLGLDPPDLEVTGRAGRRLAFALAMTRHIRAGVRA
jgi:DTW domain-containing protein YfiP